MFANSQTFWRCRAVPLRILGQFADGPHSKYPLTTEARSALQWMKQHLTTSAPRAVTSTTHPPILVFTDGACEPAGGGGICATVGGVIIDPVSGRRECFGDELPLMLCQILGLKSDTQVIGQAELLPVLIAKLLWSTLPAGRQAIYFIDNNSARYSLIKGYSPILASGRIVGQCWSTDAAAGSTSWYARAPSPSNLSDGPSRLDFSGQAVVGWPYRIALQLWWETVGRVVSQF